MQRFLAMVMSAIFIPNDEARVSLFLGLAWWVIPLVFVIPLLALTIWSSRVLKFGLIINFLCYLTVSIAFTMMVYGDGKLAGFARAPIAQGGQPLCAVMVQAVSRETTCRTLVSRSSPSGVAAISASGRDVSVKPWLMASSGHCRTRSSKLPMACVI